MAKWTLDKYIKSLRDRLDEPETDFFDDEELTRYINHGIHNMAHELQVEDVRTFVLTGEQVLPIENVCPILNTSTTPPTPITGEHDFLQVRLMMIDGVVIPYGKLEDLRNGRDVVVIWGNNFRFSEPKTGNLELYYIRKPKNLVALTDTTDVPELYQEIPLMYAQAQCYKKDGELEQAQVAMNEFEERKTEMRQELDNRESDANGNIVNITYFSGGDM
jgi:hypothetical protein